MTTPATCATCPYARLHSFAVDLPGGGSVNLLTNKLITPIGETRLQAVQARALAYLSQAKGEAVSKAALYGAMGSYGVMEKNLVNTHISRTRRILEHAAPHLVIVCEKRVGFRLVQVEPAPWQPFSSYFLPIAAPAAMGSPTSRAVSSLNSAAGSREGPAAFSGVVSSEACHAV